MELGSFPPLLLQSETREAEFSHLMKFVRSSIWNFRNCLTTCVCQSETEYNFENGDSSRKQLNWILHLERNDNRFQKLLSARQHYGTPSIRNCYGYMLSYFAIPIKVFHLKVNRPIMQFFWSYECLNSFTSNFRVSNETTHEMIGENIKRISMQKENCSSQFSFFMAHGINCFYEVVTFSDE